MEKTAATKTPGRWASRRATIKPKAIATSPQDWVTTSLPGDDTLPLMIQPKVKNMDLFEWANNNRDYLEGELQEHGGIFFRGFGLKEETDLQRFLDAYGSPLMHYTEGATPRTKISKRVYTSTEFPADETIAPHNELNYVTTWPRKIWFYCVTAAEEGGETPMVDVRKVARRLRPEILQKFRDKGWMLVRNFGDGFGLTWQNSYRVETKRELEDYLHKAQVQWEWKEGDRVQTRQVRPAVARHLKTNELVWFNHVAFWHHSSLDPTIREMFVGEFGEDGLPYNTYYGDGTPIEDEVVVELREAYDAELVALKWQVGDLMMLDNVLVAHGRKPYKGDRRILTAMAEPCTDRNL